MEGSASGEEPLGERHILDQNLVKLARVTRSILAGERVSSDSRVPGGRTGLNLDVDTVLQRLVEGGRDLVLVDEASFLREPAGPSRPSNDTEPRGSLDLPVVTGGELFGQLRLTRRDGTDFTAAERALISVLTATAGIAIENARLFQDERRRQEWLATAAEVTRTLLADPTLDPLDLVVSRVRELADADLVGIVLAVDHGARLRVAAAAGRHAERLHGATCPVEHTLTGLVLERGVAFRSPHGDPTEYVDRALLLSECDLEVGPAIGLPLAGADRRPGVLWVVREAGRSPFTDLDESLVAMFGEQVSIAWQVADARETRVRAELIGDRSRIARDLHDHVIQRLFAAGLTLHSVAPRAGEVGGRIDQVVIELDEVIKQIRSSIFQLTPAADGLRAAALRVVDDVGASLGFAPRVAFDGPVDTRGTEDLVNDVTAVLREALTNVAKHAGATSTDVVVRADAGALEVRVTDNGRGLVNPTRASGLRNMRERAEAREGSLTVEASPEGKGTTLAWRVPVPRTEPTP